MNAMLHSNPDGQPDLRTIIASALDQMEADAPPDAPDEVRLIIPINPNDLSIRCQRTWHDVSSYHTDLKGSSLSTCVVQFMNNNRLQSFFVTCVRPDESPVWHVQSWGGGPVPPERVNQTGGCRISLGHYIVVGGIGVVPDGGTIRAEMADGTVYQDRCEDNCAIVFAPVTSEPSPEEIVTIRYLDQDGHVLETEEHWIGDGISRRPHR